MAELIVAFTILGTRRKVFGNVRRASALLFSLEFNNLTISMRVARHASAVHVPFRVLHGTKRRYYNLQLISRQQRDIHQNQVLGFKLMVPCIVIQR